MQRSDSYVSKVARGSNPLPNILFILIDALRAGALSCYSKTGPQTPCIDHLAEEGVLFSDAFSCTNVTEPSLTSIFSGLYPSQHGIRNQGPLVTREEESEYARRIRFLPEALNKIGYRTMAVDWLGRWHRRGYEVYADALNRNISFSKKIAKALTERLDLRSILNRVSIMNKLWSSGFFGKGLELYDGEGVINRVINLLDSRQQDSPFFIFMHLWDLHAPYTPPGRLVDLHEAPKQLMTDILEKIPNPSWNQFMRSWTKNYKFAEEVVALYYGEVRYSDEQVGRLWYALQERHLLDNTLVVLTSDHGESLLEHGIFCDHHGLYDVSVHVPLLMYYPPILPRGCRVSGLVQHVDLLPTILEIIGQDNLMPTNGNSLLDSIRNSAANQRTAVFLEESHTVRRVAIRTERYKYIYAPEENLTCRYCGIVHGEREELYDLHDDPRELYNIARQRSSICTSLLGRMKEEWPSSLSNQVDLIGSSEVDADYDEDREIVERRLRDLGYI